VRLYVRALVPAFIVSCCRAGLERRPHQRVWRLWARQPRCLFHRSTG